MGFLRFLWRRHRIAALLLAAALIAASFFGARLVREAVYFANPAHQRQALEPWMSPRYVARSWDLPPEVIIELMQLRPDAGRSTVAQVAADLGLTLSELEARVAAARARLDAERAAAGR